MTKFNLPKYKNARARMHRRNSLWNAAKIACASTAEFTRNLHSISRAIAAQLQREYPTQHPNERKTAT
jgi:hypothetical protein